MRVTSLILGSIALASLAGCSSSGGGSTSPNHSVGGAANTGGQASSGGSASVGGTVSTGGVTHTGGNSTPAQTGGVLATGGTTTSPKTTGTGGKPSTGGTSFVAVTGGTSTSPTGGTGPNTTGGTGNAGGTASTGGVRTGGTSSTSGGGSSATGGSTTAGGTTATGGATTAGGSASTCAYKPVPNSANTTNFDPKAWYTSWKTKFYVDCGNGMARIANGQGSNNTVSEGIGYGMLLAVGAGDREALDALWAFYKGHADVNGLMNWSVNNCATQAPGSNDNFAATDGDEDAAMALVQADAKWGGYATDAKSLIGLIKKFETSQTTTPTYLRPGDAANNGGKGEGTVNPSYFAPGYWHVWAKYTNDASWDKLVSDAYVMLAAFQALTIKDPTNSTSSGALVPDWGSSTGQNPYGSSYYYDACRTPWRIATDYAWFCTPEAKTFLQNVSTFIENSKSGFASYAKALGDNGAGNSAFLGPFALSGIAVSQSVADTYLNAWLSAQMDDNPYFQGSLRGIYLLLANQQFPNGL